MIKTNPVYRGTPWGLAQTEHIIADGITGYTTASHGGIKISQKRFDRMPQPIKDFIPWAGPLWYEEDMDVCLVVLAFPDDFKPHQFAEAKKMVESYRPDIFRQLIWTS
jgi:hypothetical protein